MPGGLFLSPKCLIHVLLPMSKSFLCVYVCSQQSSLLCGDGVIASSVPCIDAATVAWSVLSCLQYFPGRALSHLSL